MLFWMSLILIVIGIICLCFSQKDTDPQKNKFCDFIFEHESSFFVSGLITFVIGAISFVIIVIAICVNYIGINARVEQNKERYNALIYKVENNAYRDDFGLLNKEVIDEVQAWNEDVIYYQNMQKNFWVGICYPKVYDQFNTIDYARFQPNTNSSINPDYNNKE